MAHWSKFAQPPTGEPMGDARHAEAGYTKPQGNTAQSKKNTRVPKLGSQIARNIPIYGSSSAKASTAIIAPRLNGRRDRCPLCVSFSRQQCLYLRPEPQ